MAQVLEDDGQWKTVLWDVFPDRHYGLFGFLADIRNYSQVPPLSPPRGWPTDFEQPVDKYGEMWTEWTHTPSWFLLSELLSFNYDNGFVDHRCAKRPDGTVVVKTYRNFLGDGFWSGLEKMKALNRSSQEVRVVFCFDS